MENNASNKPFELEFKSYLYLLYATTNAKWTSQCFIYILLNQYNYEKIETVPIYKRI